MSHAADFTATTIGDFGNVTVMEVTGDYDASDPDDSLNIVPRQVIAKEFFRLHKDEYDFLVIYSNFNFQMPEAEAEAFYLHVKNNIQGIGLEIFDNSDFYGSSGKLQGTIDMGNITGLKVDPLDPDFEQTLSILGHELLHRWASYVRFREADGTDSTALLGKNLGHWSFLLNTDGSVLYGNDWQENGDGTFTSIGIRRYYSPLDLYLMGFADKSEVPPMLLIDNPDIDPERMPEKGVTIDGTPRYITIEDIIAAEGERIPGSSESQKTFKTAFILITAPGTFTGYEIYGIENIRNGWVTRHSVLTDGDSIMEVSSILKEEIPGNPGITLPPIDPRTLPPNIDDGVTWLINNQGADGSWMDLDQTVERDTAETVLVLKNFSVAEQNYSAGLQWLNGVYSGNMDYLSRKIEVLLNTGQDVTALLDELLTRQNPEGGWGSNYSYMSNPVDTSLALKALSVAGYSEQDVISKAIEYLKSRQNSDKGWGSDDEGSGIRATVNVLSVFNKYRDGYQLDGYIEGGISWLTQKQHPDGGFGNSPSTVYDTAFAVMSLREFNVSTDITNNALNYILNSQSEDGSWNGSPYQTALAISAVWKATIDPDLSIKTGDITFIPSTVTSLPANVVINAGIWNLGRTTVSQAKVVLYDGAVSEENKISEQILAFPGQSSVTVTFSVTITDGNEHRYYIVVDPEGLVRESNEQNNTALQILYPEPTYDFEILSSDITVSANTVDMFDDVTITSRITNNGTINADNVQLRYYIDEPGDAFDIATVTVDIPAGKTITNEYIWRADKSGDNLPVTVHVDPFNSFAELSEDNNTAVTYLTVNDVTEPNLTVSYKDIVITPSPAYEGESVNISALVRNGGFAAASDIKVSFFRGVPGVNGVLLGSRTIASLNAGKSSRVSINWTIIDDSGERIIYVQVDPGNNIPEIREDDNDAFTTLNIRSLPDLAISTNSIVFAPQVPKDGDTVTITVTVKNLGEQDASDVTVRAYEGSTVIGSQVIPLISGNSEAVASFTYDTTGSSGAHEITVIVDPDNIIAEISEDNNRASRAFGVQDANLWLTELYISPNGDGVKDSTEFFFRLESPQTVEIRIVNDEGETVRTFSGVEFENTTGGSITWDGLDDEGMVVSDGQYQLQVADENNNIHGSLVVIVDNNRSPLTDAIGTEYLLNNNLTCNLPFIRDYPRDWDWLPDESGIVFTINYAYPDIPEYPIGIYSMAPDGEDIFRLIPWDWTKKNPDYKYYYFQQYLSPDGERIAFTFSKYDRHSSTTTRELWMVDIDGQNLTLLDTQYSYSTLKWSPDSKYIAYEGGDTGLWIINTGSMEKTEIDPDAYSQNYNMDDVTWSPDSKRIAYVFNTHDNNGNRTSKLKVSDISGNIENTFEGEHIWHFEWLDNEKIVLDEYSNQLWLVDTSEKGNHILISGNIDILTSFSQDGVATLNQDESRFAYAEYLEGSDGWYDEGAAYIKVSDTNGQTNILHESTDPLIDLGCSIIFPAIEWSPNGNKLAFVESFVVPIEHPYPCGENAIKLFVVDLETGGKRYFENLGQVWDIAWLSESVLIYNLVWQDNTIYFINSKTGEHMSLTTYSYDFNVSPFRRYITYYKDVDRQSACYNSHRRLDLWAMSSLLNLTADLRIIRNKSAVILKGIAADLNFEGYMLEYADAKSPDVWTPVKPPSDVPVVNDVFTTWVPPYEGTFYVRLTVWDKAGNMAWDRKRVSWGIFSSITNLYKTEEIFSPNGDGVKDTVELHYKVLEPVHLEFFIYDENNNLIRTFTKDYSVPAEDYITWDGRDENGSVVDDGKYKIKVFDFEFFVEVDNTPPDVNLELSQINRVDHEDGTFEIYADLLGHAVDNNLENWFIEYGEGDNPQEWYEYKKDEDLLVAKDENGNPLLDPIEDTPIKRFTGARTVWLGGKKFKITVEDFAGNRSTYISNMLEEKIFLGMRFNSYDCYLEPVNLIVIDTIREQITKLILQYKKGTWQDGKTLPLKRVISISDYDISIKRGDIIRLKSIDILGTEYYSNEILFGQSDNCYEYSNIKFSLLIDYPEPLSCDVISGKAVLSTEIIGQGVLLKTLSYYIQKPEGLQLLRQLDLAKEGDRITIDTSTMPEGIYPVEADLTYMDLAKNENREVTATNNLIVDRVLPTAQITYPGKSLMICPNKRSTSGDEWYGVSVEGIAEDNTRVKLYKLYYGSGDNPDNWLPAMTRNQNGKIIPISANGAVKGRIGMWDVTDLRDTTVSLKLKAIDVAGNLSCYTTSFSVDTLTEITNLVADKHLFSPNGDGVLDNTNISYLIDEYATVDVRVFKLIKAADGTYALDSTPLRTIVSGYQHLGGIENTTWDGRDDSGTVVPDGKYGVAVFATDSCGNTKQRWIAVEVDNTPPTTMITYPQPFDSLGNAVEVKGTADDVHFKNYVLEAGEGKAPVDWLILSLGTNPIKGDILGKWNTYSLEGVWTLRLTATDTLGNSSKATVTIDLGVRQDLIKDLGVTPAIFSPNNDGRLDTANINYELTDATDVTIEILDSTGTVKKSHTTTTPSAGVYNYTWDGSDDEGEAVTDGAYKVRLTAVLTSNPSVTQAEAVTVVVDTTPPIVDIVQPGEDSYKRVMDVAVNGTISDKNLREYFITYTGDAGTEPVDSGNRSRENYTFGILNEPPEGRYTLDIEARDLGENRTVKTIVFSIDRTPPKVTLDTPEEGEIYGADKDFISVTGAIEEENLETYILRYGAGDNPTQWTELLTGDTLPADPLLSVWQVGKDAGIPDGLYTLSLYAKDRAGFESEVKVKVKVDNTPPEVSITSPEEGSYVKEAVDVTGTVFDLTLDSYTIEISEGDCSSALKWATIKTATTSVRDGVLTMWQALPPDGDYCLRVKAVDKLEQKAETGVDVKVDTHPPAATVLSGEVENKTDARLNWTANTEPDLAGYNLYRKGQKVNTALITETGYLDQGLNEGIYTYTVTAVDFAGWESEPSNAVRLKIDLTGPDARIRSPKEDSKVSDIIDIKGTAYSSDDFREYRVYIGQGTEPATWNLIRRSPVPMQYGALTQWDTLGLGEGEVYSIKLETEDISGNISTHRIAVRIDNTPPAAPVLISAVADGSDVTAEWEANTEPDLAGYLLYRNDQLANVEGIVIGDLKPYLISGTTYLYEGQPDGKFRYYLMAMDEAGNLSEQSNTLEVTIDTHPPHAVILEPEDGDKFEKTIMIKAESPDLDIATVRFAYKRAEDSVWTLLGDAVTVQPYITYLDPEALGLGYGDYHLRAVATDEGGRTDPTPGFITVTYTDLTAPGIPIELKARSNASDVTLTWTANTEADLDGYNIYGMQGDTKTKINTTVIKEATYQDTGLSDGTYTYEVTAVDTYANESEPSNTVRAKVYAPVIEQPYTPTGQNIVRIQGSNAEPNVTVEIFVDTGSGPVSQGTTPVDTVGNFLFNLTLTLGENRLTAKVTDADGNVSRGSEAVIVVYNEPPSAPTGLTSTVQEYNVTLTWDPNTEADLSGYNLYRDGEKVNVPSAVTSGNTTASSFSDYYPPSNAFDSKYDTYWMSSYGYGTFNPIWWEIDLSSQELINHVEIHWGSEGGEGEGEETLCAGKDYEIQVWSGYAWITQLKVTGNTAKDNTFDFSPSYRTEKIRIYITDTTNPDCSKQVRISEVRILKDDLITRASYEDITLDDGQYSYKVIAVDYYGFESPPSDEIKTVVGDIVPPSAPINLTAIAAGADISLNWTANTEPDLAGYNIYRQTQEGWLMVNASLLTEPTYADAGLPNGTHTYRVTAVDTVGNESPPSNEASATVYIEPPPSPINLSVTPVSEGGALSATWEYTGGPVAGYNVYRSTTTGGPYVKVNSSPIGNISYLDAGLTNGVAYYYVVVAVDSFGNKSVYSNEAVGVPTDTIAPPAPEIFFPTIPGVPVTLYSGRTDISGSAVPETTVKLFEDGVPVGEVTALGSDDLQTFTLKYYVEEASLSSDGQTLAYSYNYSLWLMDIFTGATEEIVQGGYKPLLSPDGKKLAYEFEDENWNHRIGIYDIETGSGVPLTDDNVDESSPSWSSDSSRIAFISNRGGSQDVWVKDLTTDSYTRVTSGVSANNSEISPDGKKLAYFEDQSLYVVDLLSGDTIEVDSQTDGFSIDWSSDSKSLAFISYRGGNAAVFVLNAETREQRQLTDSDSDKFNPRFSPDGHSIVFQRMESEGSSSILVTSSETQGQERLLQQGSVYDPSYLFWAESGGVAYIDRDVLNILYLKGYFSFKDIGLDAGEDIFHAVATDASGNASPSSEEITVKYDTSLLPDLETTEDDIYIYPPYPVAGEEVIMNVVLWNKGQVEAEGIDVDIYIWDATGELALVRSENIPHIGPDSGEIVTIGWDSTGKTGTNTVIVVVDPEDKIPEVTEMNNYATREFYVADEEGLSMTTTLDSNEYRSSEDVNIAISLRNSGPERDVVVEVWVEDEGGNALTLLDTISTALPYASEENYSRIWNTGSTYAGFYRIHTVAKDVQNIVAENIAPFTILPDIDIGSTVVTDRTNYGPDENVIVSLDVRNNGQNYVIPELNVRTSIVDAGGNELFAEDRVIKNLLPGVSTALSSVWNTGANLPGDYSAVVEIYLDGELISSKSALFKIDVSVVITGDISVTPTVVLPGNTVQTDYTVRNSGNTDLSGLIVRVVVVDPVTQGVMDTKEETMDLGMGSSRAGQSIFSTQGYALKSYVAVLQYSYQGSTKNISSVSFTVIDGTPPVVNIISPVSGKYYNSEFEMAVTATDDASGVDRVEYRIDSGVWKLLPVSDPSTGRYSTGWRPVKADEGTHTISFRATDKAGNMSAPASTTVTIDLTPPEPPQIISPPDESFVPTDIVDIKGIAEPGTTVEMGFINIYTRGADVDTGEFTFSEVELMPGKNIFVFTAEDAAVNVSEPTRYTLYLGRLEITKSISRALRTLVWIAEEEEDLHPGHHGKEGHKGKDCDDSAILRTREFIEGALGELGVQYKVVTKSEDFKLEFSSGIYNTYVTVDLHSHESCKDHGGQGRHKGGGDHHEKHLHPELQAELREAVYRGEGLVFIKTSPSELSSLREALGVKFRGHKRVDDKKIITLNTEITGEGSLEFKGDTLRVVTTTAAVAGVYERSEYPAIVMNDYGRGSAVLFTFNPIDVDSRQEIFDIFKNALNYINPEEAEFYPNGTTRVDITVEARYADFDVRVVEKFPEAVSIVETSKGSTLSDSTITWERHLSSNTSATFSYLLRLPDKADTHTLTTEVYYLADEEYTLYEVKDIFITVDKDAKGLAADIISELNALDVSGSDRSRIKQAVKRIEKVLRRSVSDSDDAEENIEDILKAIKYLRKIKTVDISEARVDVDKLLSIWEIKWSLFEMQGS